jgi:hypothetical protein
MKKRAKLSTHLHLDNQTKMYKKIQQKQQKSQPSIFELVAAHKEKNQAIFKYWYITTGRKKQYYFICTNKN